MSIIIYNPTNETLKAQYSGVNITIPMFPEKGHKVKFEDAKAKHLLNTLGPRGLTFLEYGDEADDGAVERQKAEDGIQRNLDFKRKQIMMYNRDNEGRKNMLLAHIAPPPHVVKYAKELGEGLIEPYLTKDVKNEEIAELKKEKDEAQKALKDMSTQIAALTNLMQQKGLLMTPEEEIEHKVETIREEYLRMKPKEFGPWVKKLGQVKYSEYPIAIQQDLISKWGRFFEDTEKDPFPY